MDYNNLLLCSAEKDQQAFKTLYEQTSPLLFGILKRTLKDQRLAEDVLQEAFMKIWQYADTYTPDKGDALSWMGTIARNVARDKLRALKCRDYQEYDDGGDSLNKFDSKDLTPDVQAGLDEELLRVGHLLERMQTVQRECLIMSCQGYTHVEIAEKLDASLGSVKTWIKRGKSELALKVEF